MTWLLILSDLFVYFSDFHHRRTRQTNTADLYVFNAHCLYVEVTAIDCLNISEMLKTYSNSY